MSRGDPIRIPTPAGTGVGEPVKVADYAELALQYHLTGAADVSLEMSLQKVPAQWVSVGASFANMTVGDAVLELPEHTILWLRANVTTALPAGDTLTVAGCALRTS